MASLQATSCLLFSSSSCSSRRKVITGAISVPKLPKIGLFTPKIIPSGGLITNPTPIEKNVVPTTTIHQQHDHKEECNMTTTQRLYAILEAVCDRVEMHNNIGEQRNNWNTLLLNSINMITLTAATMAGVAATGDSYLGLKLSSTLLFSAATGMMVIVNKIQPSQLAEEQRNAVRLFKQLQREIETVIAVRVPCEEDVEEAMERVLALDKAYPLPLLGSKMIEKFPKTFETATWWPSRQHHQRKNRDGRLESTNQSNGWSEEMEMEMREIVKVLKTKDTEDYERLGNLVLKINKFLAISGPLLTGIAAVGSFSGFPLLAASAGALATVVNGFEHGAQVGMVLEMYRNCGGFFKLLEESIESTLDESEVEKRENGEMFEMKVALKLGRSLSELRDLARKSSYSCLEGTQNEEFASKLF
ncbi:hypothetical protein LWI29_002032 [Acer saccharum]|uniref:F-box protein n=1 Tax=Acer saccharum TaxID=4024 RepID=A0AA39RTH3_ACESA|nr:hypothetical protein LWI29_002032 [Acer saccharum]KAK1557496.1 hypothetical protein Q3G72_025800 [Acer saccharum]